MSRAASTDIDITSDMTELFFRDSSSYLEKQQSRIKAIVLKFVRSGLFRYNESRDIIQYINERLLTGLLDKMQAHYNRSFKLQSYFSKIVCNLCLEFAKKEGRRRAHEKITDFSRFQISSDESIMAGLVLREIYRHLDTLFAFYGRQRHRIELFFRILLRTGISERDVRRCYPHCSDDILRRFLLSFENSDRYKAVPHTEIYHILMPLVNELEGSNITPDTLRKFVDRKFDEIAEILNIPPISASLTRDTVKILLENYYSDFPEFREKVI